MCRSAVEKGRGLSGQRLGRTRLNPATWALASLCALAAVPAQAAISINSVAVTADGSGPFDADNAPGHDSGEANGIVRTQDTVLYTINYNATDTSNSVITATLPAGMRWDPSATAASVCNGPGGGSLNDARNALTCNRLPSTPGVESFQVLSWVGAVGHGTPVAMTAASGASSATSPTVTVSATAKTDTRVRVEVPNMTRVQHPPGSGVWMRSMPMAISLGAALPASGNFKGYEALQNPVAVTVKVQPGAVVLHCPGGASCSQSAPGADVTVQFNNDVTHYLDAIPYAGYEAQWRQTTQLTVQVGVPEAPNFPAGQVSRITAQLADFAPLALSGQPNAVPAPGYQAGFICVPDANLNATQTCFNAGVDRTQPLAVSVNGGTVHDDSRLLYNDAHSYTQGHETVLPGQPFFALLGLSNASASEEAATDAQSCVAWDPALLELRAAARLKLTERSLFIDPVNVALPDVAPADMVIEYSAQPYADNAARRAANCGMAGDRNPLWTSDYASLPADSITSVRYLYRPDLQPGQTVGLVMPLQRSTGAASLALADRAPLPWFRQYFTDATGTVYASFDGNSSTGGDSGGGYVQAASALARHSIGMPASVTPGNLFPITVTPRTIGSPIAGVNGVSRNVEITLDFPNTYIQPLEASIAAALPPGAEYELSPANLGSDGLPGTGDGETPAKLVLKLKDLAAPGGAPGPAPYQGHMTAYAPITFQAQAAYTAPVGSYTFVGLVSANNDPSRADYNDAVELGHPVLLEDRTERVSTTVSGVGGFRISKSLVSGGTEDNADPANPVTRITAGEPFTYAISFGNATSTARGQLRMVDVLPFDGDNRGTTALGPLQMLSTLAVMGGAGQGTIHIEFSTTAAATVQAQVLTPGNEDAATGVAWTAYTGGAFPAAVTALRFTTTSALQPGFSGMAHLEMRSTTALTPATQLFNDVFGRELSPGGLVLTASGQVQLGGQAAASLTGNVFNDLNLKEGDDADEAGVVGVNVTVTCEVGPACTVGQSHTAVTNADGVYSFAPGATVDGEANFPGLASGTWTLNIAPEADWSNRGSVAGTVNGTVSGDAVGRSISGIVVPTGASAVDYVFTEYQLGSLTINKALALPDGVSGPFDFGFTATCDLPTAGFTYPATLLGYPTNTALTIDGLPAGANCLVTEDQPLPAAPDHYQWAAPTAPNAVVIPASGNVAVTVTNALTPIIQQGNIVVNATTSLPDGVAGPFSFTLTATCDLPTAGTVHTATLNAPPGAMAMITGVQAGAQCAMTQTTPDAPVGFRWADPAFDQAMVTVEADTDMPVALANSLTRVQAANPVPVPVDSRIALLLLAMLMAGAAGLHMRKR